MAERGSVIFEAWIVIQVDRAELGKGINKSCHGLDNGDAVEADEPIVELETDKVNLEVPSPVNGTLHEISAKDGEVVEVGALLGSVNEGEVDKSPGVITKSTQIIVEQEISKGLIVSHNPSLPSHRTRQQWGIPSEEAVR